MLSYPFLHHRLEVAQARDEANFREEPKKRPLSKFSKLKMPLHQKSRTGEQNMDRPQVHPARTYLDESFFVDQRQQNIQFILEKNGFIMSDAVEECESGTSDSQVWIIQISQKYPNSIFQNMINGTLLQIKQTSHPKTAQTRLSHKRLDGQISPSLLDHYLYQKGSWAIRKSSSTAVQLTRYCFYKWFGTFSDAIASKHTMNYMVRASISSHTVCVHRTRAVLRGFKEISSVCHASQPRQPLVRHNTKYWNLRRLSDIPHCTVHNVCTSVVETITLKFYGKDFSAIFHRRCCSLQTFR